MITFKGNEKGPKKMNTFLDPDDKTIINTIYGADSWIASTVYHEGDVIKPTADNGYFYECIKTGKSSTTEPLWDSIIVDEEVIDNNIIWKAHTYNLWLNIGETLTNSVWTTTPNTIQLNYSAFDNISSSIMIESIPANLSSIILTNQVTKSNGEKLSKSFEYKVNNQ